MPELRKDPVVGRWVIISTGRRKRPMDFNVDRSVVIGREHCPFCAGHEEMTPPEVLAFRQNGAAPNGPGWDLRVVPNKFPALQVEGTLDREGEGIFDRMSGIGAHEVIIGKVRDAIRSTEEHEDWSSNDLLMGDVLRRHELQVWFLSEHVVDVPLVNA